LALKLGRPTILMLPSPEAAAFFGTIEASGPLYEVQTPEAAVEVIERRLGIARWTARMPEADTRGRNA
jgi:hypothetical protein